MRSLAHLVLLVALLGPVPLVAEESTPPEIADVGVSPRLGETIALDATFRDHAGRKVRLGDILGRGRPAIVTFNYYTCPMLCSLQLRGLINGLRGIEWTPGEEFDLVSVSFDPDETQENAARARDGYLKQLRRLDSEWHFLTGDAPQIARLLESVGMRVKKDESGQWAHPAVAVLLSPEGRITQYLYGVHYEPKDIRLALMEASEGQLGSLVEQVILTCYRYDPARQRYVPFAMGIMRLGGSLTALLLFGGIFFLWRKHDRQSHGSKED